MVSWAKTNCLCFAFLMMLGVWGSVSNDLGEMTVEKRHDHWMFQHGWVRGMQQRKHTARLKIFQTNVEFVESFNAAGRHWGLMNLLITQTKCSRQFTTASGLRSWTQWRLRESWSGTRISQRLPKAVIGGQRMLAVTPVKNQSRPMRWENLLNFVVQVLCRSTNYNILM